MSRLDFLVHENARGEIRRRVSFVCRVVRESDFTLIGTRMLDLSPGGMLVMTLTSTGLRARWARTRRRATRSPATRSS